MSDQALCVTVGPRGEIVSGGADGKVKRFVDPSTAKAAAASA